MAKIKQLVSSVESRFEEKLKGISLKFDEELSILNEQVDGAFGYVDTRMDFIFVDKVRDIDKHLSDTLNQLEASFSKRREDIDESVSYRLKQMEEVWNTKLLGTECKLNSLQEKITALQAQLDEGSVSGTGPESRINHQNIDADFSTCRLDDFEVSIEGKLASMQRDVLGKVPASVDEYLTRKEVDFAPLLESEFGERLDNHISSVAAAMALRIDSLQAELDDYKSTTDFLSNSDNLTVKVHPLLNDINVTGKKIEQLTKWITSLQTDIQAKNKLLENLDLKSRGLNLLIDGLPEIPNEDTPSHTCGLLAKFVPQFERSMVDTAFRLGRPQHLNQNKVPRRVMLYLTSNMAKETILGFAGAIANAGAPGARVFINEDILEPTKRRRTDMYKYVCFLKEKGISAVQKGDGVIFNNTLYRYDEILNMEEGFSFKDSRTKRSNGVLAFQSQFSPLSNLFISPLKRNGIVFRSAEHAFQYAKALDAKQLALAKSILTEPCSYEAMAIGKRIPLTAGWQTKQLGVMEEILRLKLEQVPAFAKELKASDNHHLVENTRSFFWGSGTYFNAPYIFTKHYPGRNNLGKLLEKVRDLF